MLIDKIKKNFHIIITIFLLILLDLITKWLVVLFLKKDIVIFPGLKITLLYNKGGVFGFGNDVLWFRLSLIITRILFSFLLPLIFNTSLFKNKNFCCQASYALLYAGCIGNLIDILFYWPKICGFSGVIDWVHLKLGFFDYVFNLADAYISIALVFLIIYFLFTKKDESKSQ